MCKCGGASEHDHLTPVTVSKSLYSHIELDKSSILNAKNPKVFHESVLREKFFTQNANDNDQDLRSECDDQLLINIQFSGTVKVKGIDIFGSKSNSQTWPTRMKIFVNALNVDFTNVNSIPIAQEFTLLPTESQLPIRYATRAAKFFNVNKLTILLEGAVDGGKFIELNFLGFEGEFSQSRVGAVKAEYEVKPMLTDHKTLESIHSSIN